MPLASPKGDEEMPSACWAPRPTTAEGGGGDGGGVGGDGGRVIYGRDVAFGGVVYSRDVSFDWLIVVVTLVLMELFMVETFLLIG